MSRFIGDKRKVVCLIIIVCIVFLSLLGILFVGRTTAGHTACIYSNGRPIKTVELDSERRLPYIPMTAVIMLLRSAAEL